MNKYRFHLIGLIVLNLMLNFLSAQESEIFALHRDLAKNGGECLLVCQFDAKANPHSIGELAEKGFFELNISMVIVDNFRSSPEKGLQIVVRRYSGDRDHAEAQIKSGDGKLFFVFRQKLSDGTWFVDPQDPSSIMPYSKKLEEELRILFK